MRPKLVFYLLVLLECFLLLMLVSPGVYRPKSLTSLQVQYRQNPSPELQQRILGEQARLQHHRYAIFGAAIAVGIGMVTYARVRKL